MKLAFIGMGVMGLPMAGHLKKAGYQVTVFNRSPEKALKFQELYGGRISDFPADAAKDSDVTFLCVGNDDDVRKVTLGEKGVLATMRPGSILVDHTTTSENLALELSQSCSEKNISFLDI